MERVEQEMRVKLTREHLQLCVVQLSLQTDRRGPSLHESSVRLDGKRAHQNPGDAEHRGVTDPKERVQERDVAIIKEAPASHHPSGKPNTGETTGECDDAVPLHPGSARRPSPAHEVPKNRRDWNPIRVVKHTIA